MVSRFKEFTQTIRRKHDAFCRQAGACKCLLINLPALEHFQGAVVRHVAFDRGDGDVLVLQGAAVDFRVRIAIDGIEG